MRNSNDIQMISPDYRFNHYGTFLKRKYGAPVFKIMVDGGFTCPNRDGTKGVGGCIYCNNEAFTVGIVGEGLSVADQVREALELKKGSKRYRNARFLVYFQKYTNTYGAVDYLTRIYEEALVSARIAGIVVGTRPDCISEENVDVLGKLSEKTDVSVELGVQSISDEVLEGVNRGHGYRDFERSASLLKDRGIDFGVHMIYGLPGDSHENFIEAAERISALGASLVKLNHIHVVKETGLEKLFRKNLFTPPSYEEYLTAVCDFLEHLSPRITVARLIGTVPESYLIAPKWEKGSSAFIEEVNRELSERGTSQGSKSSIKR